ncbi:MAG: NUDIX hydrolase [Gaiellaceae bacterium]
MDTILAAGGVPWRRRNGELEVLVVHRPQYDDWTLPKGKVEEGETDEEAAVREVEEETGLRCGLGEELPSTSYSVNGVPKRVRWWAVEPEGAGAARPQNEVDDVAWLALDGAAERLSHPPDREVLAGFLRLSAKRAARGDSRAAPEPDRSDG